MQRSNDAYYLGVPDYRQETRPPAAPQEVKADDSLPWPIWLLVAALFVLWLPFYPRSEAK